MALDLGKSKKTPLKSNNDEGSSSPASSGGKSPTVTNGAHTSSSQTKPPLSKLVKTGKEAWQDMEKEEEEKASNSNGTALYRFRVKPDEERRITFLDGNIDDEGYLDIVTWKEHRVLDTSTGRYIEVACLEPMGEPCPACEANERRSVVGGMTVIDHSDYTVKNGPNAGKVLRDLKRLFVAKPKTLKVLRKMAAKRGGLAGCTFDVSRQDDKSPAVGDVFDFVDKNNLQDIKASYGDKADPVPMIDHIPFMPAQDMVKRGIGSPVDQIGSESGLSEGSPTPGEEDDLEGKL